MRACVALGAHRLRYPGRLNSRMPAGPTKREYPLYLYLYLFRFRDPVTGKWHKARCRAELHEIRERYGEFELDGEPMVIEGPADGHFNPFGQR